MNMRKRREGAISAAKMLFLIWLAIIIVDILYYIKVPVTSLIIISIILLLLSILLLKWRGQAENIFLIRVQFLANGPAYRVGQLYRMLKSEWRPPIIRFAFIGLIFVLFNGTFSKIFLKTNASPINDSLLDAIQQNISLNDFIIKNMTLFNATIHDFIINKTVLINTTMINATTNKSVIYSMADADICNSSFINVLLGNLTSYNTTLIIDNAIKAENISVTSLVIDYIGKFHQVLIAIWDNGSAILLIWVILEILLLAWSAHKKVIIENFEDKSGKSLDGILISNLLAIKIAELNDIFSKANETRSMSTSTGLDQPMKAGIKIDQDAINELIGKTIGTESSLSLGWLTAPAELVSKLILFVLKPPTIAGAIHKDKDAENNEVLVLTAHISGGQKSYNSWQVRKKISNPLKEKDPAEGNITPQEPKTNNEQKKEQPSEEPTDRGLSQEEHILDIEEQITELACRIFTDFVFNPYRKELVRWKATCRFSEGLKAYRDCLRSRLNKKLKLIEAEKKFLETLAEDEQFNMVYYNLGVLYNEMGRPKSAEIAFLKSIEKTPSRWEAYYALGLNLFEETQKNEKINRDIYAGIVPSAIKEDLVKQYEKIIQLCERAIILGPKSHGQEAEVYDLMGLAQRFHELIDVNYGFNDLAKAGKKIDKSIISHKKAVSLSYLALFDAYLNRDDAKDVASLATKCLMDLAIDYYYHLYDDNHSEKSIIYSELLLKEAINISPEDERLHTRLRQIYKNHGKSIASNQFEIVQIMDCASSSINMEEHAVCLSTRCKSIIKDLEKDLKERKISTGDIEQNLRYDADGDYNEPLIYARVAFLLRENYSESNTIKAKDSKKYCLIAIEKLLIKPEEARRLVLIALEKIDIIWDSKHRNEEMMISAEKACNDAKDVLDKITKSDNVYADKNFDNIINLAKSSCQLHLHNEFKETESQEKFEDHLKAERLYLDTNVVKRLGDIEKKTNEFLDACLAIGDLYFSLGTEENYSKSEYYYKRCIEILHEMPQTTFQLGLHTKLGRALVNQSNRFAEALQDAEYTVSLDPLDYRDRSVLGWAYTHIKDYAGARAAWEKALNLNPDDPSYRFYIGVAHIFQAQECIEPVQRREIFEKAKQKLEEAIILFESRQINFKAQAHYWLSVICSDMGEYDHEIMQLNISRALTKTGKLQLEEMIISYCLAEAYLKKKMFQDSENELKLIIANAQKLKDNNELDINATGGEGLLLDLSFGHIFINALLYLSLLYTNQSTSYVENSLNCISKDEGVRSKLDQAFELASSSNVYISELKNDDDRTACQSTMEKCLGRICYKKSILGRPELAEDRINEAIKHLDRSINLMSEPETYLFLAKAFRQKLVILINADIQPVPHPAQSVSTQPTIPPQESNHRQEIIHLIQSIEQCYNYLKEVDINNEFLAEFDEINKYIEIQKTNIDKNKPNESE
jgi:tetratricopeptide (TPR) repeat protein